MRKLIVCFVLLAVSCGGGGSAPPANGGNGDEITFLAASRYFPTALGHTYSYRLVSVADPITGQAPLSFGYTTVANPLGAGTYFDQGDTPESDAGAVFDGLHFLGTISDRDNPYWLAVDAFDHQPGVLPDTLTAIGQTWDIDLWLGNPGDPNTNVEAKAKVGAVEDITVQGQLYQDCIRVDLTQIDYQEPQLALGLTGKYWLAPDVGVVRGVASVAGIEVARVDLVGRT